MEFTEVVRLDSEFEADLLVQVLEEEGIRFRLQPHFETALSGLLTPQQGWATVLAPAEEHLRILEILGDVRESYAEGEGGEEEPT